LGGWRERGNPGNPLGPSAAPHQKLRVRAAELCSSSEVALELLSAMEKKQSRYQGLGWRLARERIGQLVRENYPVNQEMSPRLAEFIKKIENGSAEVSTEMFQLPGEKQDD
jgi:hypothetical protein